MHRNSRVFPLFSSEKSVFTKIEIFFPRKARGAYPMRGIDGEDLKGAGTRRSGLQSPSPRFALGIFVIRYPPPVEDSLKITTFKCVLRIKSLTPVPLTLVLSLGRGPLDQYSAGNYFPLLSCDKAKHISINAIAARLRRAGST